MAYTIVPFQPNRMSSGNWQHQGHQHWYRAVASEVASPGAGALNIAAHLVPLLSGAAVSLFVVPKTGDITGLDLDLLVSMADLTDDPSTVLGSANPFGAGTGVIASDVFSFFTVFPSDTNAALGWGFTDIRPHLIAESTAASTFDLCIAQTPGTFIGRTGY